MARFIICLIFLLACGAAAQSKQIEILAQKFEANKTARVGVFSGDVRLNAPSGFLRCERLKFSSAKDGKIERYEAANASEFSMKIGEKTYTGSAESIVYDARAQRYILRKNVKIFEGEHFLQAGELVINAATGDYELGGSVSKPVRLVFDIAAGGENSDKNGGQKDAENGDKNGGENGAKNADSPAQNSAQNPQNPRSSNENN